ncbi:MAG TPA: hypothetical protein VHJ78_13980 [Actinomycetota bacterium]|nr:hypothetical protein [Actinomycetota bacterium]
MSLSLTVGRSELSTRRRLLLFGVAITLGFFVGVTWSLEISNWAYEGFLRIFARTDVQITSLAMGVGLAYLLGLVHVTTV